MIRFCIPVGLVSHFRNTFWKHTRSSILRILPISIRPSIRPFIPFDSNKNDIDPSISILLDRYHNVPLTFRIIIHWCDAMDDRGETQGHFLLPMLDRIGRIRTKTLQ